MISFIKEYFGLYYLFYFFSFLSIYFFPVLVPFWSVIILVSSYYLIIRKQRFDVVLALILYSRSLNGFVWLHNGTVFTTVNVATNLIPLLLYFFILLSRDKVLIKTSVFIKYKYTLLLFLLLTASFTLNFSTSYDIISKRYLPFALFVAFLVAFSGTIKLNVDAMLRFFRSIFVASIVVFIFSDYLAITRDLMESDSVFSVASDPNSFSLVYFSFTRNLGPAFDHRILAIMAYLFLLLCLIHKSEYLKLDIIISLIIVASSLSRGAILTYSFILVAYWFQMRKQKLVIVLLSLCLVMGTLFIFSKSLLTDSVLEYLQSFSPGSKDNALDQRAVFANYAMEKFSEHPIFGAGVGALTSNLIDRSLVVDGAVVTVVGDAFWYILLAEMGAVGIAFYLLFLKEVFLARNLLFVALFAGFVIQLLGTDIPDMRFYYFAILVLIFMARKENLEQIQREHQQQ